MLVYQRVNPQINEIPSSGGSFVGRPSLGMETKDRGGDPLVGHRWDISMLGKSSKNLEQV